MSGCAVVAPCLAAAAPVPQLSVTPAGVSPQVVKASPGVSPETARSPAGESAGGRTLGLDAGRQKVRSTRGCWRRA